MHALLYIALRQEGRDEFISLSSSPCESNAQSSSLSVFAVRLPPSEITVKINPTVMTNLHTPPPPPCFSSFSPWLDLRLPHPARSVVRALGACE